jgi:hypothetical protein
MARGGDPLGAAMRQLGPLLEAGQATRGLRATASRGAIVLSRTGQDGPSAASDPRFRLTPLAGEQFALSLYRRNRWERLPFQGTLPALVDIINTVLAHWAAEF